ncbi:MAG: VWA domain-containing protein, partial [Campylobacterales bacterium]
EGVDRNPLTGEKRYFLALSLDSNLTLQQLKKRPPLKIVVILDTSGSMGAQWSGYYYSPSNREGGEGGRELSKLEVAKLGILELIKNLHPEDQLAILQFNNRASTILPLTPVKKLQFEKVKLLLGRVEAGGGTNLEAGIRKGLQIEGVFSPRMEAPPNSTLSQFETLLSNSGGEGRLVILTDEMPNIGEISAGGLRKLLQEGAKNRVYTTIIGIGLDANQRLATELGKIPGANYFSVGTPSQFRKKVVAEVDYWLYPYLFNLKLRFKSPNSRIVAFYGNPAGVKGGLLLSIPTLFPAPTDQNGTKGGIFLAELKPAGDSLPTGEITLQFQDRARKTHQLREKFQFKPGFYYSSPAVEKGVLLADFVSLVKGWLYLANSRCHRNFSPPPPIWRGWLRLLPPPPHSQWEIGSCPIEPTYRECQILQKFLNHFVAEEKKLKDPSLGLEEEELREILDYCPDRFFEKRGSEKGEGKVTNPTPAL